MWESFPARVVCVLSGWCVPGGSKGLLKLSQPGKYWQAWQILASLVFTGKLAGDGSGVSGRRSGVEGGAVLGVILAGE